MLSVPLPIPPQGGLFEFRAGTSVKHLAYDLYEKNWLPNPSSFILLARLKRVSHQLQAGEYRIQPGDSAITLLSKLASGQVVLHPFTLVEGWRFSQVLQALSENPYLKHTLEGKPNAAIMQSLEQASLQHLEGRFLPNTYLFEKGTPDIIVLKRAYQSMKHALKNTWQHRYKPLPYQSETEGLIIASILEKETAMPNERAKIAGVFVRRLQLGMKLQADPTVIYALGERFKHALTHKQLSIKSPYNTYRYKGLPPTPISMPSLASLEAAFHPEEADALYFVLKSDGSHQFSSNLKQHQQAVKRYKKSLSKR